MQNSTLYSSCCKNHHVVRRKFQGCSNSILTDLVVFILSSILSYFNIFISLNPRHVSLYLKKISFWHSSFSFRIASNSHHLALKTFTICFLSTSSPSTFLQLPLVGNVALCILMSLYLCFFNFPCLNYLV